MAFIDCPLKIGDEVIVISVDNLDFNGSSNGLKGVIKYVGKDFNKDYQYGVHFDKKVGTNWSLQLSGGNWCGCGFIGRHGYFKRDQLKLVLNERLNNLFKEVDKITLKLGGE